MDTTALVKKRDAEIEGLVMNALSRIKMPVTLLQWTYVPEIEEWQLIIATPWYDLKGPRTTVAAAIDAFQAAGIYEELPMRRIFFVSPNDTRARNLDQPSGEGWLHLLRGRGHNGAEEYSASFAPLLGSGGSIPVRRFTRLEELRDFLVGTLHVRPKSADDALDELNSMRSATIFPVSLTARELKRAGLA
jgi:hypothetical protein